MISTEKSVAMLLAVLFAVTSASRGQDPVPMEEIKTGEQDARENPQPTTTQPTSQPTKHAEEAPAFFRLDYSGDFLTAPAATGDWGGHRTDLAEHGISFNVEVLQFGLGNAYGGKNTNDSFEYSGSADYILQLDTGRMGLWPGGYFKLRGETSFGHGMNRDAGAISPVNFDALFPVPNDPGKTTLTEAYALQFLSRQLFVIGGKIDFSRLHGGNEFTSDAYGQFMNTSLWQPPNSFALVPYNPLAAGVGVIPTEWFDAATFIMDSYSQTTQTGFETAFHSPNGLTLLQAFNFHVKPKGLKGNHRLNFAWSSRDRVGLEDIDRLVLAERKDAEFSRLEFSRNVVSPFQRVRPRILLREKLVSKALEPDPQSDDWSFWYDFDQYFYQEPQDPTQGVGVFGKFGWSPGVTNPIESYYALGIGGKGVIPCRDKDRFGVGYYMVDISDDMPRMFSADAEQGIELFYNIEITPWFHLTPDVQVIVDPGGNDEREPAIVYGLRAQLSF